MPVKRLFWWHQCLQVGTHAESDNKFHRARESPQLLKERGRERGVFLRWRDKLQQLWQNKLNTAAVSTSLISHQSRWTLLLLLSPVTLKGHTVFTLRWPAVENISVRIQAAQSITAKSDRAIFLLVLQLTVWVVLHQVCSFPLRGDDGPHEPQVPEPHVQTQAHYAQYLISAE